MVSGDVVLVHGAWGNPADWRWVEELLVGRGILVNALDLASHRSPSATRADDVDQLRQAVAGAAGPSVVAGWSYGGAVITDLDVDGLDLARLVYVASVPGLPPSVEDDPVPAGEIDLSHIRFSDDGTAVLDNDWFLESDPAVASMTVEVIDHLKSHPRRPIALGAWADPQARAAWREVDTTVILGRDDEMIGDAQRQWTIEAIPDVRLVDCDHFVPFRLPEVIVEVVTEALR